MADIEGKRVLLSRRTVTKNPVTIRGCSGDKDRGIYVE